MRPAHLRWTSCFALALGIHGAAAAVLIAHLQDKNDYPANAPVIAIDLAPMPVSPTDAQTDAPLDHILSKEEIVPDPTTEKPVEELKVEPEPKPTEKAELPPDHAPKPELAVLPPPKPEKPKPKKQKMASVARTPTSADTRADRAAAPSPGARGNPNAMADWKAALYAHILRYTRTVKDGSPGVIAYVTFSIDRSGGVHNLRVARSSGSSGFDQEAMAMVSRAAPVPAPPPGELGTQITLPVRHE